MLLRRRFLRQTVLVTAAGSWAGCTSSTDGSDDQPSNIADSETTRATPSPTPTTATPHPRYAECPKPGDEVPGAGAPLEISEIRGPPSTYDGNHIQTFVSEKCASLYEESVADAISDRVGEELDQQIRARGGEGETADPYIGAYLVFDFRTEGGELREVPPIGFDQYREAVPSSISAAAIVNDETHECTLPVRAGCYELVLQ